MIATALLFLSLGLDTLAVALGLGLAGLPEERRAKVGLTFAVFEGAMPLLGLFAGRRLTILFGGWAAASAALLLIFIGAMEIREALSHEDDEDDQDEIQRPVLAGKGLIYAGLSVSMDELAVGFSLGVLRAPLAFSLIYISLQAFAVTFIGLSAGKRLGERVGERAELIAGIVLALLGAGLLVSQAMGGRFS